jgi:hypothetical protein
MTPQSKRPAPHGGNGASKTDRVGAAIKGPKSSRSADRTQVAIIPKGTTSRLEVSVKEWRGVRSLEIREATAIMAGSTFLPSGVPVTLPLDKIPELIAALQAVRG